jgi:hypothetical protein
MVLEQEQRFRTPPSEPLINDPVLSETLRNRLPRRSEEPVNLDPEPRSPDRLHLIPNLLTGSLTFGAEEQIGGSARTQKATRARSVPGRDNKTRSRPEYSRGARLGSQDKIDLLGHVTILHITTRRHILRRGPRQVPRPSLGSPGDQRFHKPKSSAGGITHIKPLKSVLLISNVSECQVDLDLDADVRKLGYRYWYLRNDVDDDTSGIPR